MITPLGGIIGEKAARIAPYVIGALLIVLAFALGRCDGVSDERARMAAEIAKANETVVMLDAEAKERAAEQRAEDVASIEAKRKDQLDAIEGDIDTVRVRAACQRLREAGHSEAALPARCRP